MKYSKRSVVFFRDYVSIPILAMPRAQTVVQHFPDSGMEYALEPRRTYGIFRPGRATYD